MVYPFFVTGSKGRGFNGFSGTGWRLFLIFFKGRDVQSGSGRLSGLNPIERPTENMVQVAPLLCKS